jgi:hypothetical protein
MPAHYANFYADLAAPTHRENAATFAHTAPGAQLPGWLLSAFANLTEYHVLAYLGDDDEVHFIHRLSRHWASVRYPTTRFDGAYVGIIDEINAFVGALGASKWEWTTPRARRLSLRLSWGEPMGNWPWSRRMPRP